MVKRILLVDDEATVRVLTSEILRRAGYDVSQAAGGREALYLAAQTSFELIITDVKMPDMDGIALAGELLSRGLADRIIFISGLCESDAVRGCMAGCRAAEFLAKPFQVADLKRAVETVLVGVRDQRRLTMSAG